jgi:DNA segregation ATPase FtsK/SpoIIIE, S-DNA-T family
MTMSGLGDIYAGHDYVPVLRRVRSNEQLDRLTVQLLQGQHPDDFADRADTLAHSFGMLACRVRIAGPGRIYLDFTRRDSLAVPVPALPIPEAPDLEALPVGRREDGDPWTVRLLGSHLLVAGVTGAGKGSVLWSLIRALGPLIRSGVVQLRVIDPKGGMELAIRGADVLYHRFACDDPDDQAALLEEAVADMRQRAHRLRGKTRRHTPTVEDPLVLVVIDELAALTGYRPRTREARELYGRIDQAINLLLSQGRAVGFSLLCALQDPRKDVLSSRDLFPTRIALRLVEAEATDMVLGPGARDRGAACERIPEGPAGAGQGYVWSDGEPEPSRVRAGYPTDDDIGHLAERYPPVRPRSITVAEVPA